MVKKKQLINITKRIKLGYKENKCTSLFFIGPTGVGKTKLANLYGEMISKKVIKLDMSEYSDSISISKFIGSTPGYVGYEDNKYILNQIKDNPNATIIFDNIDKAHPKIINIITQLLEDNIIKDAKNNIINFKNNTIILISNKGSETNNIGFNTTNIENKINNYFNTSLTSKIDEVIRFNKLNNKDITKIINNKLEIIKNKYKDIKITINNEIINEILDESKYNIEGANNIDKIIKNNIENKIIDHIINNDKEVIIDFLLSK